MVQRVKLVDAEDESAPEKSRDARPAWSKASNAKDMPSNGPDWQVAENWPASRQWQQHD